MGELEVLDHEDQNAKSPVPEKEIPHMTNSAHYEAKSRRMQLMPRVEMRPSLEPHLMQ